jgi:transcriptional regulator with XRE-family HTH domain
LPFCKTTLKGQRPLPPYYPKSLKTLGDHLRKKRLDLGLLQREVAKKIGTSETSIYNWERGHATPSLNFIPRIIEFLEYVPFEMAAESLGGKIKVCRRLLGLSQKGLARQLKIDPTTLARWEKGKGRPLRVLLEKINDLFTFPLSINLKSDRLRTNFMS